MMDAIAKILDFYEEDIQRRGYLLGIKPEEQTTVDAARAELAAFREENEGLWGMLQKVCYDRVGHSTAKLLMHPTKWLFSQGGLVWMRRLGENLQEAEAALGQEEVKSENKQAATG